MVAALALLTSSCVDNRTAPAPPVVQVTAADLEGTWTGWGGSSVTLGPAGAARTARLDGQEFRFDDNWRMTGQGSWELYEPGRYRGGNTVGRGFVVHLTVTSDPGGAAPGGEAPTEPAAASASPSTGVDEREAAGRTAPAPAQGTWDMGVTRDRDGRTILYFLTSDPDNRDTYSLSRK
ncbi:hypothetical protein [Kitasatospora sp. NPDC018619]|uniref:hypothetical protein n=1 Tax=unclassified Kitasatospora TaxID=2633591 RepID=UPI0037A61A4F